MEPSYDCLFQPLYTCTWTNLQVTYSEETCEWSESTLTLTNERTSKITRMTNQSLKSLGRTRMDIQVTYGAPWLRWSQKLQLKIMNLDWSRFKKNTIKNFDSGLVQIERITIENYESGLVQIEKITIENYQSGLVQIEKLQMKIVNLDWSRLKKLQ